MQLKDPEQNIISALGIIDETQKTNLGATVEIVLKIL
jgi:hypothetical protein